MADLGSLEHASFAPLAGEEFVVRYGERTVPLRLLEARLLGGARPGATREPFALLFRGATGLRLPQGTHRIECPQLGALDIFITQVADTPAGADFEAIFT